MLEMAAFWLIRCFYALLALISMMMHPMESPLLIRMTQKKYKEMAEKAYDWNQKGYFMPDSTTNTTTRQDLFRANTAFSYYGSQHPGTATQETMNSGKEIVSIPIGRSTISTSSVNFCQWIIPAQCENPKKALAVLNLLYSDSDFQNLFRYGIEGKDYVVSDGIASYPDGVTSDSVGWGNELWLCGNGSVGYAWETDPEKCIREIYGIQ